MTRPVALITGVTGQDIAVAELAGLGWTARAPLREGLALTYDWFLAHAGEGARRAMGAAG